MAREVFRRRVLQCCWLVAVTAMASNAWALALTQNLFIGLIGGSGAGAGAAD